jgi:hypothetical protein
MFCNFSWASWMVEISSSRSILYSYSIPYVVDSSLTTYSLLLRIARIRWTRSLGFTNFSPINLSEYRLANETKSTLFSLTGISLISSSILILDAGGQQSYIASRTLGAAYPNSCTVL